MGVAPRVGRPAHGRRVAQQAIELLLEISVFEKDTNVLTSLLPLGAGVQGQDQGDAKGGGEGGAPARLAGVAAGVARRG